MSDSTTPETDANCWKDGMNEWVASNLARKLERERDQARDQVNHYRDKLDLLPIKWDI